MGPIWSRVRDVVVVAVALTGGLAACGGGDERQEGGCTPGSIETCHCLDGAAGSRTCDALGHGHSDCDCRPVQADVLPDGEVAGPDDAVEVAGQDARPEVAEGGLDVPADLGPEHAAEVADEPGFDAVEAADDAIETTGPDGCDPVAVSPCQVLFSAPVTSPVPQEYVHVTGSFTSWADSEAAGAVPLTKDTAAGEWRGLVSVPSGPYEFKYLVKWPDSAQQWCVVAGAGAFECAEVANQTGTSACGVSDPCADR